MKEPSNDDFEIDSSEIYEELQTTHSHFLQYLQEKWAEAKTSKDRQLVLVMLTGLIVLTIVRDSVKIKQQRLERAWDFVQKQLINWLSEFSKILAEFKSDDTNTLQNVTFNQDANKKEDKKLALATFEQKSVVNAVFSSPSPQWKTRITPSVDGRNHTRTESLNAYVNIPDNLRPFIEKKLKELLAELVADNEKDAAEETYIYGELKDATFELLNTLAKQSSKDLDIPFLKKSFKIRIAGVIKSQESFEYMKQHDSSIHKAITSSHNAVLLIESKEYTDIRTKKRKEIKKVPEEAKQANLHFSSYSARAITPKKTIYSSKFSSTTNTSSIDLPFYKPSQSDLEKLWNEFSQYFDNKNYHEACIKLREYLRFNNNSSAAWFNFALANYHLNTVNGDKEALRSFSVCIKINPKDFEAYQGRATVYLALRNEVRAKEDYQRALELDPGNEKISEELRKLKL